jgi:hypothetical protein
VEVEEEEEDHHGQQITWASLFAARCLGFS